MSTEPTGEWAKAMIRAKATDPRNGRPSWNMLAELSGVSTSTITKMIGGERRTSPTTVRKVAQALRVAPEKVSGWLQLATPVREAFEPPPEADLLTPRQRKAVTELIRSMVADDQEEVTGNAGEHPAPNSKHKVRPEGVRAPGSRPGPRA